ncbi:hypothetical protein PGTUg99_023181 [Puccinia graminis f. sp. tritici]|uniref:Uncharacterized protein n=1 Tax=Puccinia graminis f. sp. tritici TaxID=56615 RepID=A0A5B0RSE8_PUCGR|nr:hypothetical protein PGTUg99_023181 [Puccinia graminis f. sp. tritici]
MWLTRLGSTRPTAHDSGSSRTAHWELFRGSVCVMSLDRLRNRLHQTSTKYAKPPPKECEPGIQRIRSRATACHSCTRLVERVPDRGQASLGSDLNIRFKHLATPLTSRLVAPNKPSEGDILTKSHPATSGRDHRPLTHQLPFLNRSHWVEARGGDVDPAFLSAGTVDRNFEVENHQNFEVADQSFEVQAPHQNSDLLAVACTPVDQVPEYPRREVDWDKFQVITYSPKTLSFVTTDMMKYSGRKLCQKDNVKDLKAVGARCSRSRPERIGELVVLQPALAEFFRLGTEISAGTTYVSRLTPVNV